MAARGGENAPHFISFAPRIGEAYVRMTLPDDFRSPTRHSGCFSAGYRQAHHWYRLGIQPM